MNVGWIKKVYWYGTYADALMIYLAFALDKGADYWSNLCSWHINRETIGHTFTKQSLPMVWDYAETNVFSDSTGNWNSFIEWIAKVIESCPATSSGIVSQLDATSIITGAVKPLICTDPPYYDNIGYADLSDYFYIWLRRSLNSVYPSLFATVLTPKKQELIATPFRHEGNREAAKIFFRGRGKPSIC